MADAGEKQIIEIEYVVRADTAIANAEKMQSSINAIKIDIQQLAASSEASFANIAAGMKKAFSEDVSSKIKDIKKNLALATATEADPFKIAMAKGTARDEIKELLAARREYNEYVTKALAQINAAEVQYGKESLAREREKTNQKKALIKEERDALAEYSRAKAGDVLTPAAQAMGAEVQKVKAEIAALAAQNNKSFTQIGQDMVNKGQKPAQLVKQAVKELNTELKNTTSSGGGFLGFLRSLGTVGQAVFGFTLGTLAVQALRSITGWFKEAAKAGFDYAQALLRLEASTQILQESGMNISMRETLELVNELNRQFPIFTRKQVVEGIGYIQLLSQNLTLTNDQMKNLAEVGGALAVVLGKDLNEASKELALFLSSGYGEALQRAGILASKASVQHELLAMGIKTGYNETDAATRAQAGYNVIMQQSEKIVAKATELQKDQAFTLVKSKNAWIQMKETLGLRLVPVMAIVYEMGIRLLKGLDALSLGAMAVFAVLEANLARVAASIQLTYKVLAQKPNLEGLKEFSDTWNRIWSAEGWNKAIKIARETLLPDIFNNFTDSAIGAGNAAEEQAMIIADSVELLHEKLIKEQKDFADDLYGINVDFVRDIEDLNVDAERKVSESWSDYYSDIRAVIRKANDDVISENIKFQLDLTQLNREYTQKKADAEQKYRDKEQKAEKDFQEKLRRLREEFLFDLEDALRERDARQVLRLIRRFNLEQDRLNRERASERDDRQREYNRELDDIESQKAERLQKLNEEHQARIAAIARQGAIELRELKIKHDAELAEIAMRLEQEKADRAARYLEQQNDLKAQYQERINEIAKELLSEYELTSEMVGLIGAEYTRVYGPNGVIQNALSSYLLYLMAVQTAVASMMPKSMPNVDFKDVSSIPNSTSNTKTKNVPSNATGRTNWLATSPQIIQVGEIPEMINITPLNRMGSSDIGGKDGTIAIELWLSPDLQARVMDNTLDAVANIMLDIQRRR